MHKPNKPGPELPLRSFEEIILKKLLGTRKGSTKEPRWNEKERWACQLRIQKKHFWARHLFRRHN